MALQGDGIGRVTIPSAAATGDFSLIFTAAEITSPGSAEILFGTAVGTSNFIAVFSGNLLRFRLNGATSGDYSGSASEIVKYEVSRVGTTVSHYANDVLVGSITNSDTWTLDTLFRYGSGLGYNGLVSGTLTMVGFSGAGTRTYDFSGSGTTLEDTTSGEDGTLSSFTTGGFVPDTDSISITSVTDHECRKRDSSNQAIFTIAGTTAGTVTSVEYQLDSGSWSVLDASPTSTFTGSVTITNEQDVTVRFSNNTGITDTVSKLKAAVCIGIAPAQSNAISRVIDAQTLTVGSGKPTPAMFISGTFSALADPTGLGALPGSDGSLWPWIAQQYSDLGIPVCFGNVAVSGTLMSTWTKPGTNYGFLQTFATACGGISFAISLLGESDASAGTSTAAFKSDYVDVATDINTDYSCDIFCAYFPVGTSTGTTENVDNIRLAYDEAIAENSYIKFGGDLSVIDISSATDPLNDNLHIKLTPDATEAAQIIYSAILAGQSESTIVTTLPYQVSSGGARMFTISSAETLGTIEGSGFFGDPGYSSILQTNDVLLVTAVDGTKMYTVTVDRIARNVTLSTGLTIA